MKTKKRVRELELEIEGLWKSVEILHHDLLALKRHQMDYVSLLTERLESVESVAQPDADNVD